jgi:hypothetical protein
MIVPWFPVTSWEIQDSLDLGTVSRARAGIREAVIRAQDKLGSAYASTQNGGRVAFSETRRL